MANVADWPEFPITPKDIAAYLRIDTKRPDSTLRGWLRKHPQFPHVRCEHWEFTAMEADEVVRLRREAH